MEFIECPNCGKLLDKQKFSFNIKHTEKCPRCGMVPNLQDSQVITISEGEIGGPGVHNLKDKQSSELVISDGKSIGLEEYEKREENPSFNTETVIEAEKLSSKDTIKSKHKTNYKLADATVEENLELSWKPVAKNVGNNKVYNQKNSKASSEYFEKKRRGEAYMKNRGKNSQDYKKQKQKQKLKVPFYYYLIFYGIPILLLIALVAFTIYKYNESTKKTPPAKIKMSGPKETWIAAEEFARDAHLEYLKALEQLSFSNKTKYKQHLVLSEKLHVKALELGQKAWEQQVENIIKKEGVAKDKAEQEAYKRYGGHQQTMSRWQKKYMEIKKKIRMLEDKQFQIQT